MVAKERTGVVEGISFKPSTATCGSERWIKPRSGLRSGVGHNSTGIKLRPIMASDWRASSRIKKNKRHKTKNSEPRPSALRWLPTRARSV